MPVPGTWVFLFCISLGIFLVCPIHADEAPPVITHVYFEKDGVPYLDPVHYTVSCYINNQNTASDRTGQFGKSGTQVFTYSATCTGYGCPVYEPYYRVKFMKMDRCDLHGETRGRNFTVTNVSKQPFTLCNQPLQDVIRLNYPKNDTPYYSTLEYNACSSPRRNQSSEAIHSFWEACDPKKDPGCFSELLPNGVPLKQISGYQTIRNGTDADLKHYIQFLETCNPVVDPDCPGVVIGGRPLKEMIEFRPFLNAGRADNPCDTFLVMANRSLRFTEVEFSNSTHDFTAGSMVDEICDSRWTIPSDIFNGDNPSAVDQHPYVPGSPVESLFCSILSLFGARC